MGEDVDREPTWVAPNGGSKHRDAAAEGRPLARTRGRAGNRGDHRAREDDAPRNVPRGYGFRLLGRRQRLGRLARAGPRRQTACNHRPRPVAARSLRHRNFERLRKRSMKNRRPRILDD
jgi:hypothetical protein